jgi:hypothetical protein
VAAATSTAVLAAT